MHLANQSPDQLQTVFGGEFVQEHHRDETHCYLAIREKHDFAADLDAVLKALRSALSPR